MSTASNIRTARAAKRADYGTGDEATWGPVTDPRDPRADDPEEYTSEQPIGGAEVLVVYCVDHGYVSVTGAYVGADLVDADEFAQRRVAAWQAAIQAEVDRDREDAAECAALDDYYREWEA